MTLKEKFEQYAKQEVWEKKNYNSEECEQIADDFAIGFAEWYEEEILAKGDYNMIDKSKIELLEIYKDEKGL
jgi:hypothetical protein